MSGLRYPKTAKKAARKAHAKQSILQCPADQRRCWLCMQLRQDYSEHSAGALHKHHVYMGPLRDISEAEGFFVWLCPRHHETVHKNASTCRNLQMQTQRVYERTHTRADFLQLIGRSYL